MAQEDIVFRRLLVSLLGLGLTLGASACTAKPEEQAEPLIEGPHYRFLLRDGSTLSGPIVLQNGELQDADGRYHVRVGSRILDVHPDETKPGGIVRLNESTTRSTPRPRPTRKRASGSSGGSGTASGSGSGLGDRPPTLQFRPTLAPGTRIAPDLSPTPTAARAVIQQPAATVAPIQPAATPRRP